ncbi:glycosyltransferase [Bacillus sp. AFS055030]|uniref:glycosyltransferase family 2 protein n=1 Tax=Bacillus sp. AFS055030 TaxID=2033507 RepID=UPI000BFB9538|nr:glycosyltransferase [Bacillus sp. AFS055030]PGL70330.1 glycosyl transferase family 2 [Bacillus sp. AFS055030]
MGIRVSIIIPVYNSERYIVECIESLLQQTLRDCEFIFINDGSQDNSRKIIENYQSLDDRIKLINQENQGVSIARNNGLLLATGEYVGFVDADDYVKDDMYEVLLNAAEKSGCDVVLSNFESEITGKRIIIRYPFLINTVLDQKYIEEVILPFFLESEHLNSVVNKLYKNKVIKQNNVKFPEKMALGEDGMFNIHFFSNATTMQYIDYTGYYYREVIGSATRNISEKDYFKRALEVYQSELPEIYSDKVENAKIWQLKSIKLVNSVFSYIHIYFTPSKQMSIGKRYRYVKSMVYNKDLKSALALYLNSNNYCSLGRYEKFILNLIKNKSIIGLYILTAYSRFRNK